MKQHDSDPPLLKDVEDPFLDPWANYMGGRWVLKRPELPGIYQIATLEGHYVGMRDFRMRDGKVVDTMVAVNEPGWQGYYWSEPIPAPPREVPN